MKPSDKLDLFCIGRSLLQFVDETYKHIAKGLIILFQIFNSAIIVYRNIFIIGNLFKITEENYVLTMQDITSFVEVRKLLELFPDYYVSDYLSFRIC